MHDKLTISAGLTKFSEACRPLECFSIRHSPNYSINLSGGADSGRAFNPIANSSGTRQAPSQAAKAASERLLTVAEYSYAMKNSDGDTNAHHNLLA